LSDGKPGDENQCLGVAERLGGQIEIRHVAPGRPWVWAMPWGPIAPSERPNQPKSPISGPYPDIAIASGRRTVAYLRTLKAASPDTVTLFLKDPRCNNTGADLIWVPFHDKRRGDNVMVTLTGPHRITTDVLSHAQKTGPQAIHHLPGPRVALILGGDTKKEKFGQAAAKRLAHYLEHQLPSNMSVMVTPSRRTPPYLLKQVAKALRGRAHWIWDGTGDNPYLSMLALSDAIIVTADSHSMLSDVLATPVPVYIFEPDAYPEKLKITITQLLRQPLVHLLDSPLETGSRAPIDSTELMADELRRLIIEKKS
jgi:mitochondrial fission protein ELM1